ncbi:DUF4955 domain-containing protein [Prevotella stercorea]|uniref:DUF4955 domain-containing protein n=1 Tax=Leyella stercorea TaxID=363265 RepID=UPI001F2BB0D2|nr:DUF4955 domain-containing protein [Leyella stercorea]MCF2644051.1 DUF4955 domain-containing protein [Leyella stercorea]
MKKLFTILFAALSATTSLHAQTTTPAWQKFVNNADDNVLLDFSYAGYHHGTELPVDERDVNVLAKKLGYKVYNVCDYGAIRDDGKSDRKAFEDIINKIGRGKPNAKAIIYFPEGEYILHSKDDNTTNAETGKVTSNTLNLVMGHVIIKGAGRDKTFLTMEDPMLPTDPNVMYSSPKMISIRHNGGKGDSPLTKVTGSAKKGDMSIEVVDASKLKVGDWVKLILLNNDKEVIEEELKPYPVQSSMTNLINKGVNVVDRHQIKSIDGNRIVFEEPIMHAVNPAYGWEITTYLHYEEVGVEDLTFKGKAKKNFHHHAGWEDDGAYKPLDFMRQVNSWVRRVDFISISECMTFSECANCFLLDSEISGNRGHSSVRMQYSARGFIGKVWDHSNGYLNDDKEFKEYKENLGQYHACGISKQSIGNVIWQCHWGDDSCFESHATQPRASLFDQCCGGFMQFRMGGALDQLPNHLDDLTMWNFNCLATNPNDPKEFNWWIYDQKNGWYKTLPPTFVGFHGKNVSFKEDEMKLNENQGKEVLPGSLYEAQLTRRLGSTPQWLIDAKNITTGIESVKTFENTDNSDNKTYDLNGMPVGKNYKGVVVKKGKKMLNGVM